MKLPLRCPDYSCVSRRAKSVNIPFKTPTRGEIADLVIDSTGLKVFGEEEWKVKKHGQEKRRVWRKQKSRRLSRREPGGVLGGGVCGQKSGGGQAEAYWEQCLLEMEHGL